MTGVTYEPQIVEFVDRMTRGRDPCVRILVRHVRGDGAKGGQDVEQVELTNGSDTVFAPTDEVASLIVGACERDALAQGGVQRYALHALRRGSTNPVARMLVNVDGGATVDDDVDPDADDAPAPPSLLGAFRMVLSHQQTLMKSNTAMLAVQGSSTGAMVKVMAEQIKRLDEDVKRITAERDKLTAELHAFRQEDRALRAYELEVEGTNKRKQETVGILKMLVPHVAAKFLAGKDGLAVAGANNQALKAMVDSFSEEQLGRIAMQLTPEQQLAFFGAIGQFSAPAAGAGTTSPGTNGATAPETPTPSQQTPAH